MRKTLVTVAVITYNDADYIIKTLESINNQTYLDLELLISDDCSVDDTISLVERWLSEHSNRFTNVSVLTVDNNQGVTANCNRVSKTARGEWVIMIGGDDLLKPNCIEKYVEYVECHPYADIVQSCLQLIDVNDNVLGESFKGPNKYFNDDRASAHFQHEFLLRKDVVDALALFKRKSMLEALDYYDTDFPMQEDTPFEMKATAAGYKFWWMNEKVVQRRMRKGTLSGRSDQLIFVNNDLISNKIKKKYFYPYLHGWELFASKYYCWLRSVIIKTPLNKKNVFTKCLIKIMRLPYTLTCIMRLRKLCRNFNDY